MNRLGVSAAIVDGELVAGDVELSGDRILAVGVRPAGRGGVATPGLIDLQVNGFGEVDFLEADADGYRVAGEALLATGVTAYQPTLVTSPEKLLTEALMAVEAAKAVTGPRVLGAHLEGPFIAPRWKGAHDETYIVDPDIELAARLCQAGPVTTMTIAPERPGGMDLLDWLVRHGVIVSVGHSDADAPQAHLAFNRGARWVTHLHNAQRRFTARDPAVSAVALVRRDVTIGVIPDLVHLAVETVQLAFAAAAARISVVTDAIAAAPGSKGEYQLGDRRIIVADDAARLPDGTLAGSVLSMDRAIRNLIGIGIPATTAVAAATTVPARLIGRPELGTLRPGTPADLAVFDDKWRVVHTIVGGISRWHAMA
jgi:N-acetylglucosamine-6-phosphate deacetylase